MVKDILDEADTTLKDVYNDGAVFKIYMDWSCDVTWSLSCSPDLKAKRVDDIVSGKPIGFRFQRYSYYRENGIEYRDQLNTTALHFVVTSEGKATAVTLNSLILNISAALTLTTLVPMFVDFLMLNFAPSKS